MDYPLTNQNPVIPNTRNETNGNGTESHRTEKNRAKTRKRNKKKFFLIYFRQNSGNGTFR